MSWLDDATIEGNLVHVVIGEAIQTAMLTRSLTEASTVELGVLDPQRELLGSSLWKQQSRLFADAHHYILRRSQKRGNAFTLTFEDSVAYLLKNTMKQRIASRNTQSRVEFVTRAITAAGVKVFAPTASTAIGENSAQFDPQSGGTDTRNTPTSTGGHGGFAEGTTVTVTNHGAPNAGRKPWTPANGEQLRGIVTAMNVATDLCARNHLSADQTQAVMIAMLAAGSGESGWYKASHNDVQGGHSGIFQQSPQYYTAPSDVAIATHEFLIGAKTYGPPITYDAEPGTQSMIGALKGAKTDDQTIGRLIALVQRPGPAVTYGPYYAQFVPEARANVAAWEGVSTSTPTATPAATTAGQWTQGSATTSESVWDMGQRLMQEIAWRMFVGPDDKVWLVPDEWLFQRPAAATLHEFEGAVDTIDWTIDAGRRSSPAAPNRQPMDACSVKAFDTWNVQPGSVVQLAGEGPANGKWLVMDWERDAFKPDSTITLGAPMVQLAAPTVATTTAPGDSTSTTPATPRQFPVGTALVQPIPQGPYQQSNGGIHSTEGLSGRSYNGGTWPASDAIDFFAIAGAPVVAMENGKIVRFSGHDPRLGPTEGGGGPFGWTIYLLGDSGSTYFITHLGTRIIAVGQTVKAGQQIGTVGNYYSWTRTPNHTHVGVYPAASGHPDIHDLNSAPRAARA